MVARTVLFISPQFPHHMKLFVTALRKEGCTVLGIADTAYEEIADELKDDLNGLNEYFVVNSLEDYEEVYRAVACLISKHGRIHCVQSHNEHWLFLEAQLREDFNVKGGYYPSEITEFCKKSGMKKIFYSLGLNPARGEVFHSYDEVMTFVHGEKGVGYPIIAKPDHGVGCSNTYKFYSDEDVKTFFNDSYGSCKTEFIFEEFIKGSMATFDGLTDKNGDVIFYGSFQYQTGIMEIMSSKKKHSYSYVKRDVEPDLLDQGLKIVKAFKVLGHFFHLEFFRTEKGWMINEANLRLPGVNAIHMYNFGYNIDLFQLWADVVAENRESIDGFSSWFKENPHSKYFTCYASRCFQNPYVNTHDQIMEMCQPFNERSEFSCDENDKSGVEMMLHMQMPATFRGVQGDYSYYFRTLQEKDLWRMISFIHSTLECEY